MFLLLLLLLLESLPFLFLLREYLFLLLLVSWSSFGSPVFGALGRAAGGRS